MQAVATFNQMMGCFFDELRQVYPRMAAVMTAQDRFAAASKARPDSVLRIFADAIQPFAAKIEAHDETFLTEDLPRQPWFAAGPADAADIAATSIENKEAIFEWLSQLSFMALNLNQLPEEGMEMLDKLLNVMSDGDGSPGQIAQQMTAALNGEEPFDIGALLGAVAGLDAVPGP